MRNLILFIVLILATVSCEKKPKQDESAVKVPTEDLVMYEMSEMALLMEKMFVENED